MTTGRINQIPCSWRAPQGPAQSAGVPRCPSAPGGAEVWLQGVYSDRGERAPGHSDTTGAPAVHMRPSNCPHWNPSGSGPHARLFPSWPPQRAGTGLRHTALGWRDQTLRTRRRTAATAGRLPPGICFSMMASGQRSTDPNGAGDQTATGLRSPQTAPPRRFTASAGISAAGVGGRPRFLTRGPTRRVPLATRHSETTCLAGKL